tara:strand:- start:1573 stop:3012 length:1440 start_codon:yes stop_codon:yes gene_type:complete
MSEGRVLPKSVDYTKILPLAVESRSRRRSFFPTNGQAFADNANNIIRIDVSASAFLDTRHSYLRFRLTNNSGQAVGFDYGGGHGIIRRLRIEQAGTVLSDVNHYNKLMSAIILPSQSGVDGLAHRSLTEGQRFANGAGNNNSMNPAPAAEVSGAIVNTPSNTDGLVANGVAYTFSIPLMNGLIGSTQSKMVPLQLLGSSPLTIEIELAPQLDIGAFTAAAPAAGTSYTVDNVRYIAQLVEVGPEVDAQLRMVQEMSGGKLVLNGTDYTHFNGNVPAAAVGNQVINVPARRKSLKSLFFVGASTSYAAAGAGGAEHNFVYNLSYGGNFNMTDYQVKIGSVVYPPTPIDCQFQAAAGSALQRGEVMSELAKCWGTVSSAHGTGSLSTINAWVADCDVANMAVAAAAAAATNTLRFSPFGIDLEAFQRTAIESGINTASSSLPISLVLNIGAANAEPINVDCYVSYDSLYYIDETGAIRVSM